MAMQGADRLGAEPHDEKSEVKRNEALASYDAHPGIAIALLAVMAFLFIIVVYQFASTGVNNATFSSRDMRVVGTQNPLIGLLVLSSDGTRSPIRGFCVPTTRMSRLEKVRSEEHTSELQSRSDLVCRLLLE